MEGKIKVYVAGHQKQRAGTRPEQVHPPHINWRNASAMAYHARVQQQMAETEQMYGAHDRMTSFTWLELSPDLRLHQSSTQEPDGFVRHNVGLGSIPLTQIVDSAVATAQRENSAVVYISPDFDFEASNRMRAPARYPISDAVAPGGLAKYLLGPKNAL